MESARIIIETVRGWKTNPAYATRPHFIVVEDGPFGLRTRPSQRAIVEHTQELVEAA